MNEWEDIKTAPKGDIIIVQVGFPPHVYEYYSFFRKRSCSGLCAPKGLKPHEPHFHDEWIICDGYGDELHPPESYKTITPSFWRPLEQYNGND